MRAEEKSSCGVGFVASLKGERRHDIVRQALHALRGVEHRGACHADRLTSDGAGIMLDIPFGLLGCESGTVAVATLFAPKDTRRRKLALKVFEDTFGFFGMKILAYRKVPVDDSVFFTEDSAPIRSAPGTRRSLFALSRTMAKSTRLRQTNRGRSRAKKLWDFGTTNC
jgi:glutamate synthase domain-containing protein 1